MSARRTGRALRFSALAASIALGVLASRRSRRPGGGSEPLGRSFQSSSASRGSRGRRGGRLRPPGRLRRPPRAAQDLLRSRSTRTPILRRILSTPVWGALTERQKNLLAATVREHFARALAPPPGTTAEVAWASVPPARTPRGRRPSTWAFGTETASSRRAGSCAGARGAGRSRTSCSSDPGLSLAAEVGRQLGREPVRRRDRASEARARAWPRLAGLLALRRDRPGLPRGGCPASGAGFSGSPPRFRRRSSRWTQPWRSAARSSSLSRCSDPPAQPWRPFEQARHRGAAGRGLAGGPRRVDEGARGRGDARRRWTTRWASPRGPAETLRRPGRFRARPRREPSRSGSAPKSSPAMALAEGRTADGPPAARALPPRGRAPIPRLSRRWPSFRPTPARATRPCERSARLGRCCPRAGAGPSSRPRSMPAPETPRRRSPRCVRSRPKAGSIATPSARIRRTCRSRWIRCGWRFLAEDAGGDERRR